MIGNRNRAYANAAATTLTLLLGALLPPAPAFSQHGLDNLVAAGTITGRCQRLVVRGVDVTRECNGRIGNTTHSDDRSGFAFFRSSGIVISFAGPDHPAVGNRATLTIDMVVIADGRLGPTVRPEVIPASGSCTYTNPYAGVSTVICAATTRQGQFGGIFRSDGRPPDVQRFQH